MFRDRRTSLVAAPVTLLAPSAAALPSSAPDESAFAANGNVNAIARSGSTT